MPDRSTRDFVATYLRPHRSRLLLLAALFFAGIGLQLANPLLAKTFIDRASNGASFDDLIHIAVAFLAVALLTQLATIAEVYAAEDLGWRTTNALRVDLTAHVLDLDASFHADHGAGELLERIDGDVSAIAGFFARFVVHVLGSLVFLVGVLALMWREDVRIGALLTVCAAGTTLYLIKGGGFVGRRSRASRVVSADLTAYLEERLSALPDIKANGADEATMRGLYQRLATRFTVERDAFGAAALFRSATSTALLVTTVAALVLAAWLQRRGEITVGAVYLVFRYTGMLRMPLERLARHMNSFQRATGGIVRVRELLATRRSIVDGAEPLPPGTLGVSFDNVGFGYDAEPVLRGVSFRVDPGRVLGIVGRTGSGKTTITRLLFRLYDTTEGAVYVGGLDVRAACVADLQSRIGLVTQDVQLFAGTLRENVALFNRAVGDEELIAVFDGLGLRDWLDELPDGLDTRLGPAGRGLSAGEAQLVAMARVFLKNPSIVVLDEASSRLDPNTEARLEGAVDHLLDGRTGVVIAHRLHTIERADDVLVLDAGRVVEFGPRAELAADPTSRFAALLRAGLEVTT